MTQIRKSEEDLEMARNLWLKTFCRRLNRSARRTRNNRPAEVQPGVVEVLERRALLTSGISFAGNVLTINVGVDGETALLAEDGSGNLLITSDDAGGTTADAAAQALGFAASSAQNVPNSGSIQAASDVQQIVVTGAAGTQTIELQGGTFTAMSIGGGGLIENVTFSTAATSFDDISGNHGDGDLSVMATVGIVLGQNVTTISSNQTYNGPVTLSGADRTLTGSTVNTQSTVGGGTNALNIVGNADIDGDVTSVSAFDVSGTADLGASVSTSATQNYQDAVTVSAVTTLTANTSLTVQNTASAGSNDLVIVSDEIDFQGGDDSVSGTGVLTLSPFDTTASVGVSGGAGTLDLSTADLAAIADRAKATVIIAPIGHVHDDLLR